MTSNPTPIEFTAKLQQIVKSMTDALELMSDVLDYLIEITAQQPSADLTQAINDAHLHTTVRLMEFVDSYLCRPAPDGTPAVLPVRIDDVPTCGICGAKMEVIGCNQDDSGFTQLSWACPNECIPSVVQLLD